VLVLLTIPVALTVFVIRSVRETLLVTDNEEEALGDFVCVVELVCVLDI